MSSSKLDVLIVIIKLDTFMWMIFLTLPEKNAVAYFYQRGVYVRQSAKYR